MVRGGGAMRLQKTGECKNTTGHFGARGDCKRSRGKKRLRHERTPKLETQSLCAPHTKRRTLGKTYPSVDVGKGGATTREKENFSKMVSCPNRGDTTHIGGGPLGLLRSPRSSERSRMGDMKTELLIKKKTKDEQPFTRANRGESFLS